MPEPKKLDTWKCECPECKSGTAVPLEMATLNQLEAAAVTGTMYNNSLLPTKWLKYRITWMKLEASKSVAKKKAPKKT